jgi:Ca2+-binding EF-hand superfamily protein
MLYEDYQEETDEKKNPKLHKMLEQVREYCGNDKGEYDYPKLCKLLDEDISKKEADVRNTVEEEYKGNAAQPKLEDPAKQPVQGADGQQPAPAGPFDVQSVKQKIISHYARIPMTKDAIIKHLVPNDKFIEPALLKRCLVKDIKDINASQIDEYIHRIANDQKYIDKAVLRDALFQDSGLNKDARNLNFEDQIDQVYSDIDIEQKNAIDKLQLAQGCKYLGLNLSQNELDELFAKYKHRDSQFMDRNGFSRLLKYEYCKDISKDRIVQDRFEGLIPMIDPHRKGMITVDQLRYLFAKVDTVPAPEELDALMKACDEYGKTDKDHEASASLDKLQKLITHSNLEFTEDKEHLNNAVIKIRSKLYSNITEQYNGFKFMPSNYVSSFSEAIYQTAGHHWPTAAFRPQLSDCRTYYTNIGQPTSGEVRPQQRVGYLLSAFQIRQD